MFLTSDDTGTGEERNMNEITDTGEPASELERLIADLPGSGCRRLSSASAGGSRTSPA
jgi:hypothetical protein